MARLLYPNSLLESYRYYFFQRSNTRNIHISESYSASHSCCTWWQGLCWDCWLLNWQVISSPAFIKHQEFNFSLKAPFVHLCANTPIKNFKHTKQERFHLHLLVVDFEVSPCPLEQVWFGGLRYPHLTQQNSDTPCSVIAMENITFCSQLVQLRTRIFKSSNITSVYSSWT